MHRTHKNTNEYLVGVGDDDKRAHVHARRVRRLVLAADVGRRERREPAERLALRVDDVPALVGGGGIGLGRVVRRVEQVALEERGRGGGRAGWVWVCVWWVEGGL